MSHPGAKWKVANCWGGISLQRIKVMLQPKALRLLALGLILFASLLLLLQSLYGTLYLVAVGQISRNSEGAGAVMEVMASHPIGHQGELAVSASGLLVRSIEAAGEDAEFLAVIHRRGERLVFERIFLVQAPTRQELQGTRKSKVLGLALGTKPELVEMVGLDRFGYALSQPAWAKEKLPGADIVYHQQGNSDAIKEILDGGNQEFVPNLFLVDEQGTVVGMRSLGRRLLPLPELLRRTALVLYALALMAGLGSLASYKWTALSSAGKRIWDQVSRRGRKASN